MSVGGRKGRPLRVSRNRAWRTAIRAEQTPGPSCCSGKATLEGEVAIWHHGEICGTIGMLQAETVLF